MKVKDLPPDTNLEKIKIRIPEQYREEAEATGLKTMDVYLRSQWFSGIWVRTSPTATRMFPLQIHTERILDWDVVE